MRTSGKHGLTGGDKQRFLSFGCSGEIIFTEGKHGQSYIICNEYGCANDKNNQRKLHVSDICVTMGYIQREIGWYHQNGSQKVKHIKVIESKQPAALKFAEPINGRLGITDKSPPMVKPIMISSSDPITMKSVVIQPNR